MADKSITTNYVEAASPTARKRLPSLTTNTIQPPQAPLPEDKRRRPAKGPLITTENIEQFQATIGADTHQKKGRRK